MCHVGSISIYLRQLRGRRRLWCWYWCSSHHGACVPVRGWIQLISSPAAKGSRVKHARVCKARTVLYICSGSSMASCFVVFIITNNNTQLYLVSSLPLQVVVTGTGEHGYCTIYMHGRHTVVYAPSKSRSTRYSVPVCVIITVLSETPDTFVRKQKHCVAQSFRSCSLFTKQTS